MRPLPLTVGRQPRSPRGFALLITITLVAFLVLILVGLATLTRVETQVAANSQQQAQARQNALMALNIAIGQLQKHTGPDQRITARADIILPSSVTITPPTPNGVGYFPDAGPGRGTTGAEAVDEVDSYWRASRNRHWTGAWQNTNTDPYDPEDAVAFNARPTPTPPWLVSGNENTPAGTAPMFQPTDVVSGLSITSTPFDEILDANDRPHRLLVKASADATTTTSLDRAVTAPQVPIISSNVPGMSGPTPVGHYAWWVGDEGVKARANLIDPYAPPAGSETAQERELREQKRLQSAQRPAIEAMTTDGTDGLAADYPANAERLAAALTHTQLDYLSDDIDFPSELRSRFHDLTVRSRGVLADVKNGGLKRDLTYILSRRTVAEFRTALTTVPTGADPYNVVPNSSYNPAISVDSTPYANLPTSTGDYSDLLNNTATWEQLWSYYNMGNRLTDTPAGVFDNEGIANARLPRGTEQGLTPLVVQGKVFYRLRIEEGTIRVDIRPIVVLANPYSVPLRGDFIVRFFFGNGNDNGVRIQRGPADTTDLDDFTNVEGTTGPQHGYMGNTRLVVNATEIPPGVAQIFTVDPDDDTVIANLGTVRNVRLKNTFDPTAFLTYDTDKPAINPLTPENTHLALRTSNDFRIESFMGTLDSALLNRFSAIYARESRQNDNDLNNIDTADESSSGFRVQPFEAVDDSSQEGAGLFFTLHDGFAYNMQQSPFFQVNYRAFTTAHYSAGNAHPLQLAIKYYMAGEENPTGVNPYLAANLLPPAGTGIPSTTRWGLVSTGKFPSMTELPDEVDDPSEPDIGFVNILFDLPQPGRPVTSLGQLQHFNIAGHVVAGEDVKPATWQLSHPIGNSYPTPRVTRDAVFSNQPQLGRHYDGAYLWNDILWDRFYFSSFPSDENAEFDFNDPDDSLVNARYKPFRDPNVVPPDEPDQFRGIFNAAENLLVEGAFNINSTSVEAWKAVLSSLKEVAIGTETNPANLSAPFARTHDRDGGSADAHAGDTENAWAGFRNLSQTEINAIAEEMVLQVRLRGPFLSMSDFVNRRLSTGKPRHNSTDGDPLRLGLSGALQAAIDRVVNRQSDITNPLFSEQMPRTNHTDSGNHTYYGDMHYAAPTRISGFPGYLFQADILSALAPTLAARSDTFTIRTYGNVVNPADPTAPPVAHAWCEAIVQRIPDYVEDGTAPEEIPSTGSLNADFGRRYEIVSFRWLTPEDI
ncbi:MAG: hypothetical protein ABII82_17740 [Verrucomicrobiota bacterium]